MGRSPPCQVAPWWTAPRRLGASCMNANSYQTQLYKTENLHVQAKAHGSAVGKSNQLAWPACACVSVRRFRGRRPITAPARERGGDSRPGPGGARGLVMDCRIAASQWLKVSAFSRSDSEPECCHGPFSNEGFLLRRLCDSRIAWLCQASNGA